MPSTDVLISAAHSLGNVRKTREQMMAEARNIVALRNELAPQVGIEVGISTAFGCTIQGVVTEDDVVWVADGLGLANCLAAFDVGVRTFDASLGGLGGCPCAPGASGNVVTEDLVFMFEAMGVSTGVDITKLIAARGALKAGLPEEPLYGMVPEAALPLGFVQGVSHV